MPTTIAIRWDGTTPGLAEHRISLCEWHEAIGHLLNATRRTASSIVSNALENSEYGAKGGRLAGKARGVDLQMSAIHGGCVAPEFHVVFEPPLGAQMEFWQSLDVQTAEQLVVAIGKEARGQAANYHVRKFLAAVPAGVTTQEYVAKDGDKVIAEARFGAMELVEEGQELPSVRRFVGEVVGLRFDGDRCGVDLRIEEGRVLSLSSKPEQVEQALALRGERVEVATVGRGMSQRRLVWILKAGTWKPHPMGRPMYRALAKKWEGTLAILAE